MADPMPLDSVRAVTFIYVDQRQRIRPDGTVANRPIYVEQAVARDRRRAVTSSGYGGEHGDGDCRAGRK